MYVEFRKKVHDTEIQSYHALVRMSICSEELVGPRMLMVEEWRPKAGQS
jgi:hypothetical protein